MNHKIISTIIIFGFITVIPTVYGQLTLGGEAKQELIEVKMNLDGEINVKHIVNPSNTLCWPFTDISGKYCQLSSTNISNSCRASNTAVALLSMSVLFLVLKLNEK